MLIIQAINLLLFGFAVGVLGTYIGAGGGFLHVPTLLYFYGAIPQQAIGTSLVVVFFNALSGTVNYAKQKRIDYKTGWKFALATVPGSVIGVYLTRFFDLKTFSVIFGVFLMSVAVITLIKPLAGRAGSKKNSKIKRAGIESRTIKDSAGNIYFYSFNFGMGFVLSVFIGFCSSCLGVGGGILHVPALIHLFNFPVHIATATSHFILAISAFCGSVLHYSNGNVMIMPALCMSIGTIIGAQIGAAVARKSRPVWITAVLGIILFFIGFQMSRSYSRGTAVNIKAAAAVAAQGKNVQLIHRDPGIQLKQPVPADAGVLTGFQQKTALPGTADRRAALAADNLSVSPSRVTEPPHSSIVHNTASNIPHTNAVTRASPGIPHLPATTVVNSKTNIPSANAVTKASPKFLPGENLLGADVIDVDETIASQFSLPVAQGVLVNGIKPGSGADTGGLKRGDIIVKFEGARIRDVNQMERHVQGEQAGETVNLKVIRDGSPMFLFVTIGEKPASMKKEQLKLAAKAGIHIGYVILIIVGVFFFLLKAWSGRVFVVCLGAAGMVWLGMYHGFYDYRQAFKSILWDTLALLLGMNLISAVLTESGFFNYAARKAVLIAKGRKGLLFVFFCLITFCLSCFVNNLSAIIIILPVLFGLARNLEFDPKPYIIGVIVASNLGGASTMIGDFPNILIGSRIGIPFTAFLVYMAPVNLILLPLLLLYIYKSRTSKRSDGRVNLAVSIINRPAGYYNGSSSAYNANLTNLMSKMRKQLKTSMKNRPAAVKAGIVLFAVLVAFLMSDYLNIPPAIIALTGGAAAVLWSGIGIKQIARNILVSDFVFFIALFILIGGVQAIGLLGLAAEKMLKTAGGNALALNLMLLWCAGIATCFLNAGPSTALFIPIVKKFSLSCPHYLFWWSLSLGVCAGSSGTLTGATAGPVSATMYDRLLKRESGRLKLVGIKKPKLKDRRLSFANYAKTGIPVMLIYLLAASFYVIWLYNF